MGESAEERRQRLRALRAAKELLDTPDEENASTAPNVLGSGDLRQNEDAEQAGRKVTLEEPGALSENGDKSEQLNPVKEEEELSIYSDDIRLDSGVSPDDSEEAEEEKMSVKFRNYVPLDKSLQEHKLAPPSLPKFEDPVSSLAEPEKTEDPFLNIAPKKPNWDLRRDVQKRLDKLERRTQKALYELYVEQEERQAAEGADD